jgi:hypothetical protein
MCAATSVSCDGFIGTRHACASATEPRLQRNLLLELHDDIANGAAAPQRSPQRLGGAPDQVRVIERHACRRALDRKGTLTRNAADRIVQRQRLEYGAQLVKAVGPHAEDAEIEIDLRVGPNRDSHHGIYEFTNLRIAESDNAIEFDNS